MGPRGIEVPDLPEWLNSDAARNVDFSERYAERNERDYQEFAKASRSGRLQAIDGV